MTLFKLVLLGVLVFSVLVAVVAFLAGERTRQAGSQGPRPLASVGEALRLAQRQPTGRALILFLQEGDPVSQGLEGCWQEGALRQRLEAPHLHLVVLRGEPGDAVLDHLHAKYTEEPLAAGPSALVLDGAGQLRGRGRPQDPGDLVALIGESSPRLDEV